jgi:hypothetical protein
MGRNARKSGEKPQAKNPLGIFAIHVARSLPPFRGVPPCPAYSAIQPNTARTNLAAQRKQFCSFRLKR